MTDKDKKLIELAETTSDWMDINPDLAESEEAREILHERMTYLYHIEEGMYGLI